MKRLGARALTATERSARRRRAVDQALQVLDRIARSELIGSKARIAAALALDLFPRSQAGEWRVQRAQRTKQQHGD